MRILGYAALMVAGALIVAGLLFGFMPADRGGSCGSVFSSSSDIQGDDVACAATKSDRKVIALGVGIPGVVFLLGGLTVLGSENRREGEVQRDTAA